MQQLTCSLVFRDAFYFVAVTRRYEVVFPAFYVSKLTADTPANTGLPVSEIPLATLS